MKALDTFLNEKKQKVYITFMNKDKGFKKEDKYFDSYEEAEKWGRKELDNFHPDMISYVW